MIVFSFVLRMYFSLPQLFVFLFDVMSVAVFVIRNRFVKKADLCLNLFPCVIKYYVLSVCLSLSLCLCLSLSLCLSVSVSLCVSLSLSVCLSVCLSVSFPPPHTSLSFAVSLSIRDQSFQAEHVLSLQG